MQSTFLSKAPVISKHPKQTASENSVFSIIIPSWNNLEFLKTCIASLRKNSRYTHQIIVHLNEGADGSLAWVKEQALDFTYSTANIGICYAMNLARTLASTELLVYFNDDMYACPDWDFWLYEEVKKQPSPYFFFSSTMIEPHANENKHAKTKETIWNRDDTFELAKQIACSKALLPPRLASMMAFGMTMSSLAWGLSCSNGSMLLNSL